MAVSTRLLWPVGCGLLLLGAWPAASQAQHLPEMHPAPVSKEPANCLPPTPVELEPITTITLDFDCRCFEKSSLDVLNRLRPGQLYRLRILHINPLLYKITLGVRDTTTQAPLNFPTYATLGASDLAGLAAGLAPVAVALAPATEEAKTEKSRPTKAKKGEPGTQSAAQKVLDDYRPALRKHIEALASLAQRVEATLLKYGNMAVLAQLDYTATHTPTLPTPADVAQALAELAAERQELAQLRQQAELANAEYAGVAAALRTTIDADDDLKQQRSRIDTTYQQFSATLTKVLASTAGEGVQALLKSLTNAANASALQYVSLPQQFTSDQSKLRIDIVPRGTDATAGEFHTQLIYPLTSRQFWGVSTGFFASRLGSEAYSARPTTLAGGATTYRLVAEDPGKFEYGLSAMVRYGTFLGPRSSAVGVHLGFGPALAVSNKVRPRLLLGGGLVAGRTHKLLADAGLALGYVDRLSRAYDLSTDYPTAPPDNPVVSTLKASFYFGLHYLFTR